MVKRAVVNAAEGLPKLDAECPADVYMTHSTLLLPILDVSGAAVLGVLQLMNRAARPHFEDDDIAEAQTFASLCALALARQPPPPGGDVPGSPTPGDDLDEASTLRGAA